MTGLAAALLMVLLIALRMPIAIALLIGGFAGYAGYEGFDRALSMTASIPADLLRGYSFSVVPLFVFMGAIAARSGLSDALYNAARAMSRGNSRGSLASATIGACAMFGSICGSSIATAATMTPIAMPEMKKAGYSDRLAAGSVAAGGTIGILIPPSVILVVYAILVEESVAKLFAAALIPGLLLTLFCIVVVRVRVGLSPELAGPPAEPIPPMQRLRMILGAWKIVVIFGISLGGIYLGWFSPTEAAAVGSSLALLIAVAFRTISLRAIGEAVVETISTSAMIFFIFLGALMFSRFVALTKVPETLAAEVAAIGIPAAAVLLVIVLIYLVLGCFLDTVAMILITAPVFLPLVVGAGYDAVWFGVLVVVVAEMGLITPPVGMNIFIIRAQVPDIPLGEVIRGVTPFLLAHAALIVVLIVLPQTAGWLPSLVAH